MTGGPYVWGALLVAVVVTGNVALGGMRSITFVQAFQYWLKLTALAVPVVFLMLHWQADGRPELAEPTGSTFAVATHVTIKEDVTVTVDRSTVLELAAGSTGPPWTAR